MKDINKIIQELYLAYVKKDLILMKSLLDEWKNIDTNNIYIKKYEDLYNKLNSNNQDINNIPKERIVKFWWKTIKCPHCWANLALTEDNRKVIENFKSWDLKELNLKCSYCNTEFKWNTKWLKSLYLNISVWNEITLDNKKYRVSWWVRYIWNWKTINSWSLEYIERILIDEKWDTYYLSESKAWWNEDWESWIEYQTEISRKIVPDFNIWELSQNSIIINNNNYRITEICEVIAKEVYGENSKSFTIWEKITTFRLNYNWKDYIFEQEETNNQKELWIYHTWEVNDRDLRSWNIGYSKTNKLKIFNFSFWKSLLAWAVLFFISLTFFSCEKNIKEVTLNDITNKNLSEVKWLYKINFSDIYKKDISESTTRYDYWGIKHTIKYLNWIKFKIETQEDLDILKQILDWNLDIKSWQIPKYNLDFTNNSFSSYFTWNTIINFK